mmetsp:Transcript_60981/g.89423  ORF Transcript_60981/g.89423 Transcript_60981/m.89423 type:complete len:222 (+) Transcript_60981:318-983(+)
MIVPAQASQAALWPQGTNTMVFSASRQMQHSFASCASSLESCLSFLRRSISVCMASRRVWSGASGRSGASADAHAAPPERTRPAAPCARTRGARTGSSRARTGRGAGTACAAGSGAPACIARMRAFLLACLSSVTAALLAGCIYPNASCSVLLLFLRRFDDRFLDCCHSARLLNCLSPSVCIFCHPPCVRVIGAVFAITGFLLYVYVQSWESWGQRERDRS